MSLAEINQKLQTKPYLEGYTPSKADADLFNELFGNNQNVIQWAARLAAYFESERQAIAGKSAGKAATPAKEAAKPKEAPKAKEAPKESPKPAPKAASNDDDDIDLFGEVTEEEKAALAKKKADEEAAKKAKKAVIQKSNIVIDIKPWEDTCDLEALMLKLRAIERDGLVWGAHKLQAVAYGIKKLVVMIVIEDDKVSGDDIEEMIMGFEDDVQSMDIQSWNKV